LPPSHACEPCWPLKCTTRPPPCMLIAVFFVTSSMCAAFSPQAASFSCLRAMLPHVTPHLMGPKSLLAAILRAMRHARAAKAAPHHHVFLVQVR
jgi:hypothetical protein